jgi:polyribonucleotide nucleotidyltransferase
MESKTFTAEIGGRQLEIGTGQLANQAGAAVTVRYGDTIVLATATMTKNTTVTLDEAVANSAALAEQWASSCRK